MTLVNAYETYRQPLIVLTDDDYRATGAITIERDGRFSLIDTKGVEIGNRKTYESALRAATDKGFLTVSSAWYESGREA